MSQVAQVTRNFTQSGILVHAYLMYGYPTQTIQETVDSLEMVRQLFEADILQSGFWHQFALTAHSPIGLNPEKFGIKAISPLSEGSGEDLFALNDLEFTDKTGINHEKFSFGLKKSLFNYLHGIGFDYPLQEWFEFKIPKTTIPKNYIQNILNQPVDFTLKPNAKVIWLGNTPEISFYTKTKKGNSWEMAQLTFQSKKETFSINLEKTEAEWLHKTLCEISLQNQNTKTLSSLKTDFENQLENFELFWFSKPVMSLREKGLIVI